MRKIGNKKNQKYEDMRKYSDPKFLAKVNPQLGIDFSDDKFIEMGDGYAPFNIHGIELSGLCSNSLSTKYSNL